MPTPTGPTMATCVCASRKRRLSELVEQRAIEGDLGGRVPALELHLGLEVRALRAHRGGVALAAIDLVAEQQHEKVLMRHLLLAREREPLGQRVEQLAELQPAQRGLQVGVDHVGGHVVLLLVVVCRCARSAYSLGGRR